MKRRSFSGCGTRLHALFGGLAAIAFGNIFLAAAAPAVVAWATVE